jgi:hypothetical protein
VESQHPPSRLRKNGAVYSAGTKIKLKITSPLVNRRYPPPSGGDYVSDVELEYDDGWVETSWPSACPGHAARPEAE